MDREQTNFALHARMPFIAGQAVPQRNSKSFGCESDPIWCGARVICIHTRREKVSLRMLVCYLPRASPSAVGCPGQEVDDAWGAMADDININDDALRAVRDALVAQLVRLEQLGEGWSANELSLVIDRLNNRLGEAPSEEEIERLRRNLFMN